MVPAWSKLKAHTAIESFRLAQIWPLRAIPSYTAKLAARQGKNGVQYKSYDPLCTNPLRREVDLNDPEIRAAEAANTDNEVEEGDDDDDVVEDGEVDPLLEAQQKQRRNLDKFRETLQDEKVREGMKLLLDTSPCPELVYYVE